MSYNLIETYNRLIQEQESQYVESSVFSEKPIMTSGVITPDSTISIQPMWGIEFKADKEGMGEVLQFLEEEFAKHPDGKLLSKLSDIYSVTERFLGGHGIQSVRESAYLNNNRSLALSDIKGKNIGLCAERATMAHNCLTVLEGAGILSSYSSKLTNSYLMIDGKSQPHSFVMLVNKDPRKDSLLFDVENLLQYKQEQEEKAVNGIGLYSLTPEQLQEFIQGKSLKLQSIWEKFGMQVVEKDRFYGNEKKIIIEGYGE